MKQSRAEIRETCERAVPRKLHRRHRCRAEPSREQGTTDEAEPSRAENRETFERAVPRKQHRPAAAEPSRDLENPVSVPCHAPITSIQVIELYCVTLPPLLLYLG
jgi:hypothetical protein